MRVFNLPPTPENIVEIFIQNKRVLSSNSPLGALMSECRMLIWRHNDVKVSSITFDVHAEIVVRQNLQYMYLHQNLHQMHKYGL